MQLQGGVVCITHIQLGSGAAGAPRCVFSAQLARDSGQINKDRSKGGKNTNRSHIQLKKNKKGPLVQQTLQKTL